MTKDYDINKIKELISQGKENGQLTSEEIKNKLENFQLSSDDYNKIYNILNDEDIEIIDEESSNEESSNEGSSNEVEEDEDDLDLSVTEGKGMGDPVRMYLRGIGKVDLLTKE